jgi:hypothetical protein
MPTHYSKALTTPTTRQEGLANAIQLAINHIEAGKPGEALLGLVDLLDDVSSRSNPYRIGRGRERARPSTFRGTVNVD